MFYFVPEVSLQTFFTEVTIKSRKIFKQEHAQFILKV